MPTLNDSTELLNIRSFNGATDFKQVEYQLSSLATRQDGCERRLMELGGMFDELGDLRGWAQSRLDDVDDLQRSMAVDLKVVSAMTDENFRNQLERPSQERSSPARDGFSAMDALHDDTIHRRFQATTNAQIAELRRRADVHSMRLRTLAAAAGKHHTQPSCEHKLLRSAWHEWCGSCKKEVVKTNGPLRAERSADVIAGLKELRRSFGAAAVRMDEHERRLADLREVTRRQELHLSKVDAALDVVMSADSLRQRVGSPSRERTASASSGYQLAEFLETLSGQAKAVEDLEVVVREELRAGREFAEAAAANIVSDARHDALANEFSARVSEQGQVLEQLRDLVLELCKECKPFAQQDLTETSDKNTQSLSTRVIDLEGDVASMQEHLGALVAVVKYIRHHASDALEDRVQVAMNDVHHRVQGCIGSLHERLDSLRPLASSPENITQMPPSTVVGPARAWLPPANVSPSNRHAVS